MPTVQKISRPWIKKYDQQEKHDNFYNNAPWRKLRAIVLAEDPLCYYCRYCNLTRLATIADHFKPRKLFPELSLIRENIKGCCDHHHQIKRQWEKTISTRDMFEQKIPELLERMKVYQETISGILKQRQ